MASDQISFRELNLLEDMLESAAIVGRVETLGEVEAKGGRLPVHSLIIGPDDPSLPCFGLFAGVHGLENVGTHVAVHYLQSFVNQLSWDEGLQERMTRSRLIAVPLINPGGMYLKTRSNPEGIDLMRNAPQDSVEPTHFLVGGHRFSPKLPWYRGKAGAPMAKENQFLTEFLIKELFPARVALSLDIHSGFGMRDRLWFPYAKTKSPFPGFRESQALKDLLRFSYPHHIYKIEGQAESYLTSGDYWDFIYDLHREDASRHGNKYIP